MSVISMWLPLTALAVLLLALTWAPVVRAASIVGVVTGSAGYVLPTVIDLYLLQTENTSITIQQQLNSANIVSLLKGDVDFAVISGPLSTAQAAAHPNLTVLPIMGSAIVPVYRLDALNASTTLTFSGRTLALIYGGNVTTWDDPNIQRDNPGVALPHQNITVGYQLDARTTTTTFVKYLVGSLPSLALTPSTNPSWPLNRYASSGSGFGAAGVAAFVVNVDGSIGWCIQQAALQYDASVAQLINAAGNVVSATQDTVALSLYELLAAPTITRFSDLVNCDGSYCWPMLTSAYVLLDNNASPRGCAVRQAVSSFWQWYFQSTPMYKTIMLSYVTSTVPDLISSRLDLLDTLQDNLHCGNEPLVANTVDDEEDGVVTLDMTGPERLRIPLTAFGDFQSSMDGDVRFAYESQISPLALQEAQEEHTLLPFYYQNEIFNTSASIDTTDFVVLPTFLTSIVFTHNLALSPTVTLNSSVELIIDFQIILRIIVGNISDWHDPRILALNPVLATVLDNNPAPITFILSCQSSRSGWPLFNALSLMSSVLAYIDPEVAAVLSASWSSGVWAATETCQTAPGTHWQLANQEVAIPALVSNNYGSIGYMTDATPVLGNGKFAFVYPHKQADGSIVPVVRHSDPDGLLACAVSGFDPATLSINVQAAALLDDECWPMSQVVLTQLPRYYTYDEARLGVEAVEVLRWLYTDDLLETYAHTNMIIRTAAAPDIQAALLAAVLSVTDENGEPLIRQPITWSLPAAVTGVALFLACLGGLLIVCAMVITIRYQSHPVFRSSSPVFMLVSFLGLLHLCGAIISLSFTNQTDTICAAFTWFTQLGFTLLFAPLLAKAYRIYRIFGQRRRIKVVKLTNVKLLACVGIALAADLIFFCVWFSVAPPSVVNAVQYVAVSNGADGTQEYIYPTCAYAGTSSSFFIAEAVVKIATLLVGVMLAFGVRSVTSQFNESKSIGLSVYNLTLMLGVIIPILVVINAVGTTANLLLLFLLVEVTFATLGILFLPKLLAFNAARRATADGNSVSSMTSGQLSENYSFMQLSQLSTPALLQPYIGALEKHMGEAKKVLAGMKRDGLYGGSRDPAGSLQTSPIAQKSRLSASVETNPAAQQQLATPTAAAQQPISPAQPSRAVSGHQPSKSHVKSSSSAARRQAWSHGAGLDHDFAEPGDAGEEAVLADSSSAGGSGGDSSHQIAATLPPPGAVAEEWDSARSSPAMPLQHLTQAAS